MISQPNYKTDSNNPNIKPKWSAKAKPAQNIRIPKMYHKIAWDISQAIDQGLVTEEEVREWLEGQIQ